MIPTRSQIESYSADHLVDAADYWSGLAERWEEAHWQVRNQAHSLLWEGAAGDALADKLERRLRKHKEKLTDHHALEAQKSPRL